MNKSDSERIAAVLEKNGYKLAPNEDGANLILANMCSIRQSAVDRIYGLTSKFAKLKNKNPKLKTILTGCVSTSDLKKFRNLFDYVLSIKTLSQWPGFLKEGKFFYYPNPREKKFNEKLKAEYLKEGAKYLKNFSVFIPISTGCDNFCSFCIVPYVRGSLICRPHQDILKEIKFSIETGAKDIWLLGQNVNDYHSPIDYSINFPKVLKLINKIKGNFWIRFTSPHPKNFSDKLIETMAKCEKVTPYLNLPIQSGDDEILKKMNRPYTVKQYKNLIRKIRQTFKKYRKRIEKNIALSTDIIVGFPGETKKQFQNTVKFFKEMKFDMAYIARYSPRPGTAAAKLKDNVSLMEKERRYKILTDILKKTALEKNKKYIAKVAEVLSEEYKNGFLIGKTRHYKTVKFKGKRNLIGQFVKVNITDTTHFGLKGCLV